MRDYNNKLEPKDQQMLYNVNSPYYRQFLSSTVNKKYQKNLEKLQGGQQTQNTENRGNVNPSSVGVWFIHLYFIFSFIFISLSYSLFYLISLIFKSFIRSFIFTLTLYASAYKGKTWIIFVLNERCKRKVKSIEMV